MWHECCYALPILKVNYAALRTCRAKFIIVADAK